MSKKPSPGPTIFIPGSFTVNLAKFWLEAVPMQPDTLQAPGGCRCVHQSSYHQSCLWRLIFFWASNILEGLEISMDGCRHPFVLLCAEGRGHQGRVDAFVFPGLSCKVCYWLELKWWELLCVITPLNCWNCLKDRLYITLMAFITFSSEWKKTGRMLHKSDQITQLFISSHELTHNIYKTHWKVWILP